MSLTFRCPQELKGLLPEPVLASQGLPGWVRSMPAQAYSALVGGEDDTVKRCPPFIDAMTCGFLIPLVCDVTGNSPGTGSRRPRPASTSRALHSASMTPAR